jgi:hypothetical protein
VIVFNNTAAAFNPAAGPGVMRRETGIRFDRLTLVFSSAANGAALGGLVGIPVFIAWHWLLHDIHGESFSLLPNWMATGAALGAIVNKWLWWRWRHPRRQRFGSKSFARHPMAALAVVSAHSVP